MGVFCVREKQGGWSQVTLFACASRFAEYFWEFFVSSIRMCCGTGPCVVDSSYLPGDTIAVEMKKGTRRNNWTPRY